VKRLATSLRTDRPVPDESTTASAWDGTSWGFTALDGLPDPGESAGYAPPHLPGPDPLRLSTGQVAAGFDHFEPALFGRHLDRYARERLGIPLHDLMALGRLNPNDPAEFLKPAARLE